MKDRERVDWQSGAIVVISLNWGRVSYIVYFIRYFCNFLLIESVRDSSVFSDLVPAGRDRERERERVARGQEAAKAEKRLTAAGADR